MPRYMEYSKSSRNFAIGRWTVEEDQKLIQILMIHGKNFKFLEQGIKTRKTSQICAYMQKFFNKLEMFHNDSSLQNGVYLNQAERVQLTEKLLKHEITAKTHPKIIRFLRSRLPIDISSDESQSDESSQSDSSEQNFEMEIACAKPDLRQSLFFIYQIFTKFLSILSSNDLKQRDQAQPDITASPKQISKERQKVEKRPICEGNMIERAAPLEEYPENACKQ